MHHALLVCGFERIGDLLRDRQRVSNWYAASRRAEALRHIRRVAPRNHLRQRRALDQLHHDRAHLAGLLQAADGGDVGMIE